MDKINWNENFKIRLASCDDSMMLHDIVKLMVVKKLLKKHLKDRNFLRIYTEYEIKEGIICDAYLENIRTKECFAFEIQKSLTEKWKENTLNKYKDWEVYGFNSADLIIIPLKDCPEEINKISDWLNQFIF